MSEQQAQLILELHRLDQLLGKAGQTQAESDAIVAKWVACKLQVN